MDFNEAYEQFSGLWESPLRFYHTRTNHLDKILPYCNTIELKYFALFHDIVYDPYSESNEEDSVQFFRQHAGTFDDLDNARLVEEMILATKHHKPSTNDQINKAVEIDMAVLHADFGDLLAYENGIFKEYQKVDLSTYLEKRVEFLSRYKHIGNIPQLIEYIKNKSYSIGLYAGSFDPFHVGHLDIVHKAEHLFDKVIIVRAVNPEKPEHRYTMPESLPNEIIDHAGLITKLFDSKQMQRTLIRGIRNEYDIASEMNYMAWVHEMDKDIPFVHIFCDQENIKVSSSTIRSFSKIEGFDASKWVVK